MPAVFTRTILSQTISWQEYYDLARQYTLPGDKPERYLNEKMLRYTADNIRRMDNILQTINIGSKLYNNLTSLRAELTWIVLTEPWCGDASQIVPLIYMMASCTDRITMRILQSDAHPEVMSGYLTRGSRSIPKLICLRTAALEELGTWGPRPMKLQKMVMDNIDNAGLSFGAGVRMVHEWYEADKTISIQEEFIDLVKKWGDN